MSIGLGLIGLGEKRPVEQGVAVAQRIFSGHMEES
jgi:hypothetical protein